MYVEVSVVHSKLCMNANDIDTLTTMLGSILITYTSICQSSARYEYARYTLMHARTHIHSRMRTHMRVRAQAHTHTHSQ
jgi:hypothetical protein